MRFTFTAQDMETMHQTISGTSKILNILDFQNGAEAYANAEALCLGQLKTLFGEPLYITENLEDQYSYCILATDEKGVSVYLHAYSGPSGPAIGGNNDTDSKAAADELVTLLLNTQATDYDYEGVYMDGPCAVKMGVRNGIPYMEETELEF